MRDLRIGVLQSYINHTTDNTSHEVSGLFARTLRRLSATGAQLISVDSPAIHPPRLVEAEVAVFEFREAIDGYLREHPSCPSSLDEIVVSGLVDDIAVGPTWLVAQQLSTASSEYVIRLRRIEHLKLALANLFAQHRLDALIYPHQTILVVPIGATFQPGRNGLLTSLTGAPGAVIPMGFSTPTERAKLGVPIGMEVIGLWGWDKNLLAVAGLMERVLQARRAPLFP